MKEKLNGLNAQFWSIVFPRGRQDAHAVSQELVRLQKNTIKSFCETVNARAQEKIETIEGYSYHKAMKAVCAELGVAVDLPIRTVTMSTPKHEEIFRHDWSDEELEKRKALLAEPKPRTTPEPPSVFGELPQEVSSEAPLSIPSGFEGAAVPPIYVEPKGRKSSLKPKTLTPEQPLT